MHLREPQQREYEAPDAEPEHHDGHLAKPQIPLSVSEARRDGCHQVEVSNNGQRKERQGKNPVEVPGDPRTQEYEPADLCNEDRPEPEAPHSQCWTVWNQMHSEN